MEGSDTNVSQITESSHIVGDSQLLDDATARKITEALLYGVVPFLACLGVTWNVFSIIILVKHGLNKCSNILLVSLAFSDATYLISVTNIPNILYELQGDGRFLYSETVSHFLYVMYVIATSLDYMFGLGSLTLPMLITIERVVAVFMPLQFSRIITPVRTWFAVAGVMSFWIIYLAYTSLWYQFEYNFDQELNRSVGIIGRSDLFYKDQPVVAELEEVFFSMKIPPLFTLVGCTIIIIKLKFVSMKRKKLSNNTKAASTTRTTKMLLAVCIFYVFTCAVVALPTYLPKEYMSYALTSDTPSNLGKVMYILVNSTACVNGTWNFLVYVGFNKNFRETFKELTVKRCYNKG